ncbi:MAG: thiamine diphosphokinase [Ignavibacteriaceae bacterium]
MKKCIILANGKPPKKSILTFFKQKTFSTLICADGGANTALKLNLLPDIIIGDFDSVSDSSLLKFQNKSKMIRLERQNDTDVEKCLKYAVKNKFRDVLLAGVTGNRLDHTFCNLGIVLKFFSQINISLVAEESFLRPVKGDIKLKTFPGETISLYGFDDKTKITSHGLKYPLRNISLPFGKRESTSNVAVRNEVELNISGGIIFIIRNINVMLKYDLF